MERSAPRRKGSAPSAELRADMVNAPPNAPKKATGALNVLQPVNDPLEFFDPSNGAFSRVECL